MMKTSRMNALPLGTLLKSLKGTPVNAMVIVPTALRIMDTAAVGGIMGMITSRDASLAETRGAEVEINVFEWI